MKLLVFVAIAALHTPTFADRAAELIKGIEGFKSSVYLCQGGHKSIGYGFTDKRLISKGYISRAEADRELIRICVEIRQKLRMELKRQHLTAGEEAAVISFIYNVGWGNFKSSKMFRLIIRGKRGVEVSNEFKRWVYVTKNGRKVKSRGIQKRRYKEAAMFRRG